MATTAVWALWTTAEHVGSMARPTTDDNITVYDDAVFCVDGKRCDAEAYQPCMTQPLESGLLIAGSRHSVTKTIH